MRIRIFFPFNIVSLFNQYKCCTRPLKNVLKDMQRQDDNLCSTFMKQPQFGYIALIGRRAKTDHKIIVLIIIPTVIRCFFFNCDQKMNTSHHECASYLHISLHNAVPNEKKNIVVCLIAKRFVEVTNLLKGSHIARGRWKMSSRSCNGTTPTYVPHSRSNCNLVTLHGWVAGQKLITRSSSS